MPGALAFPTCSRMADRAPLPAETLENPPDWLDGGTRRSLRIDAPSSLGRTGCGLARMGKRGCCRRVRFRHNGVGSTPGSRQRHRRNNVTGLPIQPIRPTPDRVAKGDPQRRAVPVVVRRRPMGHDHPSVVGASSAGVGTNRGPLARHAVSRESSRTRICADGSSDDSPRRTSLLPSCRPHGVLASGVGRACSVGWRIARDLRAPSPCRPIASLRNSFLIPRPEEQPTQSVGRVPQ